MAHLLDCIRNVHSILRSTSIHILFPVSTLLQCIQGLLLPFPIPPCYQRCRINLQQISPIITHPSHLRIRAKDKGIMINIAYIFIMRIEIYRSSGDDCYGSSGLNESKYLLSSIFSIE